MLIRQAGINLAANVMSALLGLLSVSIFTRLCWRYLTTSPRALYLMLNKDAASSPWHPHRGH